MNEFLSNLISKLRNTVAESVEKNEAREQSGITRSVSDSLHCPYCGANDFVKRGTRKKKLEVVQLYLCKSCRKTFTPQITKGKHYPLDIVLDAVSIYNLGYSLEETCRIVNARSSKSKTLSSKQILNSKSETERGSNPLTQGGDQGLNPLSRTPNPKNQKTAFSQAASGNPTQVEKGLAPHLRNKVSDFTKNVKSGSVVELEGFAPSEPWVRSQAPYSSSPTTKESITEKGNAIKGLSPATLATWIKEFEPLCRYCQMRPYVIKKYSPKEVVIHTTLAHRQLYRYRYHRGKCELLIENEYKHRRFGSLREYLEMVPGECPHQYFQQGLRASETPLTFSKTAMIVRAKQNFATRLCEFVLQSVKERKDRHEQLQKFMLANDSVTVATEVPVYITRDDLLHMQTQLGFEIYQKDFGVADAPRNDVVLACPESLPKLITGHIDILQIRNGSIHILDYKPKAAKEQPIEQLTLYAMALSRLTGLRLFEFKCAWFDEKDYFEFYPLHVLHKTKKAKRRRKIATTEGTYLVNKAREKVENLRPV